MSLHQIYLHEIPPPKFSDGVREFSIRAQSKGWSDSNNGIQQYFAPLRQTLMEVYNKTESYYFEQGATLNRLPENYNLMAAPGQLLIVGHPRNATPESENRNPPETIKFQMEIPENYQHMQSPSHSYGFQYPQSTHDLGPNSLPSIKVPLASKPIRPSAIPSTPHLVQPIQQIPQQSTPQVQTPVKQPPQYTLPSSNIMVSNSAEVDDPKFKGKLTAIKTENASLEKEVEILNNAVKHAKHKLNRLKFEQRFLLGAMVIEDNPTTKRALEYTSDNSSNEAGTLSEPENDSNSDLEDENDDITENPKVKQRKKRRIKLLDPNAPKRPANAFILFCELQRECIKEERRLFRKRQPGSEAETSLSNLTKALGLRWRQLAEEDRKIYQDMFRDQVKQYDADIAEYMATHPNAPQKDADQATLPPNWTDPNAPKRPANAFFVFCEMEDERIKRERKLEKTEEQEDVELSKISQSLGQRWRTLQESEKEVYEKKFNEQMIIYKKYMEEQRLSEEQGDQTDMLVEKDEILDTQDEVE
ncbi:hypothetical protein HDV01_007607 [Terramyces sp. JEL0728]|nr:hypothetical protein HDV01_007607 [Terramyces sp. JEL0728]